MNGSSIGDVAIGSSGTGEIDDSGGAQTSAGYSGVTLGFYAGSQGTYKLTGTSSLNVANQLNVGVFGAGTFVQGDGAGHTSNTVADSLYISGGYGGAASSYTRKDGALTVGGSEVVGFAAQGSFTQTGGTNTVVGDLILGLLSNSPTQFGSGAYTLNAGTLNTAGKEIVGSSGAGTFTQNGDTNNVNGSLLLGVHGPGVATFNLNSGILAVTGGESVGRDSPGTIFNQSGGTHTVIGGLDLNGHGLVNSGYVFNLSGDSLVADTVLNHGATFNYSGGSLATTAGFTNQSGQVNISGAGTRNWGGDVINNAGGTFKVTNTTVAYTGTFTNNAAYISDPAINLFNNLTIGSTGYLQGGAGDVFSIAGNLVNHSNLNTVWHTGASTLTFAGSGPHEFDFAGVDLGQNRIGYTDNFAFGDLSLALGEILNVMDGNPGNAGTAFYAHLFQITGNNLAELANIHSAFNIYYDQTLAGNAYLAGGTYALNGGGFLETVDAAVVPTPEPGSLVLLATGVLAAGWYRRRAS